MARMPLTEERVAEDCIILDFGKAGMSDEQFVELCADNRELHLELTAQKELVIMTLPGGKTGRRNVRLSTDLEIWARVDGTGVTFSPLTLFRLPNGARRAPDASWVRRDRWEALTDDEQEKIPPLCPDFVAEIASPSDKRPLRFRMLQAKMAEYMANGARLAWLIDPFDQKIHVYRPDQPVESLDHPLTVSGEPVLRGFVFNAAAILESPPPEPPR